MKSTQPGDDEAAALEANGPDSADDDSLEAVPRWRPAAAIEALRRQVNAAAPLRSKLDDGTVGDAAHQSRSSDHNPWVREGGIGVVTAVDITHDPSGGCDSYILAKSLRASADPRIKYIISNGMICSSASTSGHPAWTWRPYSGKNKHDKHVHVSVKPQPVLYDSQAAWTFKLAGDPSTPMS